MACRRKTKFHRLENFTSGADEGQSGPKRVVETSKIMESLPSTTRISTGTYNTYSDSSNTQLDTLRVVQTGNDGQTIGPMENSLSFTSTTTTHKICTKFLFQFVPVRVQKVKMVILIITILTL